MDIRLKPETESQLMELAARSGRAADDLVEDAMAGFLDELGDVQSTLDRRYREVKSGAVKLIDGEEFFETLRQRENDLINKRSQK
jgi:predicted DNA-binding protein